MPGLRLLKPTLLAVSGQSCSRRAPRSSFKVSELTLPEMHQEAEAMNQSFLRPFRHLS